jgi:hypothetical protein
VTLAERWDGIKWSIQATPNPSLGGGILFGVSCSSASACTAVGASNAGTLAERWNGTKWVIQPTPNPPSGGGVLVGVSCSSASACTAVGASNAGNLAERWNGTKWSIQPTPNPSGSQFGFLNGVSCTSSSACEAVGFYVNSSGTGVNLAERWKGTKWSIQPTPNPSGSQFGFLNGVSCTSSSACEAVGSYLNSSGTGVNLAERWNGTNWVIQPTPNPSGSQFGFNGVSCTSSSACEAVGSYLNSSGTGVNLAERWNGTNWVIQPTPNPSGSQFGFLNGVSCTSSSACEAVGSYLNSSGTGVNLAERWNGTKWSIQPTPNRTQASTSGFGAVSCPMPSFCMAAGSSANGFSTPVSLAESWNGNDWKIQKTPNLPGQSPAV